jgi:endonuclease YncB( thermonuclease family)
MRATYPLMKGRLLVSLAIAVCALSSGLAFADDLRGRVVGVTDGDTLTLLDAGKLQHKIRLNGIDAPESRQAFGQASKRGLADLVLGQDVVVVWSKVDRYGRIVGTVLRGTVDVNLEQLRAGMAWYFRRYESDVPAPNRLVYDAAEAVARRSRLGLWRDESPTAPWVFRGSEAPTATITRSPSPPRGAQSASSPLQGLVIGNRNSRIYHVPGCRNYNDVAERNRVYFKTEAEAAAAGFWKAKNCR